MRIYSRTRLADRPLIHSIFPVQSHKCSSPELNPPKIWHIAPQPDALTARYAGTIASHMGIQFVACGENWLSARMPVDARTRHTTGMLHTAAAMLLAETVGTCAASLCVDPKRHVCSAVETSANHLRTPASGWVVGIARPYHLGDTAQTWGVEVREEEGGLASVVRLTIWVEAVSECEGAPLRPSDDRLTDTDTTVH